MAAPPDGQAVRALVLLTSNNRRGAEIEGFRLAGELNERGLYAEAVALAPGSGDSLLDVPVLGRKPLGPPTLRALRDCARQFDLVIAYGSSSLPACAVSLIGTGVPFIYRSIGDPTAWVRGRIHRWRTGVLLRRSSHVVALWPDAADSIKQLYSIDADRISVIPNARSNDEFHPATDTERSAAREFFNLPTAAPIVGYVGSISPEKRPHLAVDAVAELADVHLLVVGDGPQRVDVEHHALELLGDRATFTGSLDNVVPAYQAMDLLLLTSRTEGMPGVVLEAAMSGLPVVSTAVGAIPWMFENGIAGELIPAPVSPMVAAQTIERRLSATVHVDATGLVGWSWPDVATKWADTAKAIASGCQPRST